MGLCLQLGLNHELDDTAQTKLKLDSATLDSRRRMTETIHIVVCRDEITAKGQRDKDPKPDVQRRLTRQRREMGAEILPAMSYPFLVRDHRLW